MSKRDPYCHVCTCRPEHKDVFEPEGGITTISKHNAHLLLDRHGLPDRVEITSAPHDEFAVTAIWNQGIRHVFGGFSWGYGGEGPHGLAWFLEQVHAFDFGHPITMHEIARWPREDFDKVLVKVDDRMIPACPEVLGEPTVLKLVPKNISIQ